MTFGRPSGSTWGRSKAECIASTASLTPRPNCLILSDTFGNSNGACVPSLSELLGGSVRKATATHMLAAAAALSTAKHHRCVGGWPGAAPSAKPCKWPGGVRRQHASIERRGTMRETGIPLHGARHELNNRGGQLAIMPLGHGQGAPAAVADPGLRRARPSAPTVSPRPPPVHDGDARPSPGRPRRRCSRSAAPRRRPPRRRPRP